MSPLSLRRHRAERLLREEFETLRGRVLRDVRAKLRASDVSLDQADLQECYAMAWHGLYTLVLDGEQVGNPTGWLVLVTFRRALDEHRARVRAHCGADAEAAFTLGGEHDLAAELDDRARVRQLFEGLRGRLDARELEAATLCYLHGLSRAQAAARMGVSEARMRKLMEGRGPGRPGVAAKVGAIVGTIRDGDWCEEQGSLMRALAFGILDPAGERYRLALMHHSRCPSCRAYVVSLRGLAAALPPVFGSMGLAGAALTRAAEGVHSASVGTSGAALASGTAGASGAASGSWLFGAGPLGAKLAAGCMLALGVGAGCVALDVGSRPSAPRHGRQSSHGLDRRESAPMLGGYPPARSVTSAGRAVRAAVPASGGAPALTPQRRARLEFGPERAPSATESATSAAAGVTAASARSASVSSASVRSARAAIASPTSAEASAEREFAPG